MNQAMIASLTVAGFVLVVDMVITWLRRRARSKSVVPESPLTEKEIVGEPQKGVTIDQV